MSLWHGVLLASALAGAGRNPLGTVVRSSDPRFVELLQSGHERSPTFRRIIASIGDLRGVVYVERGRCAANGSAAMAGCLLHAVTAAPDGTRILRIVVSDAAANRWIALVGHELQHAYEALEDASVVDGSTMTARFRSLDPGWDAASSGRYETRDAQKVEAEIRRELERRD